MKLKTTSSEGEVSMFNLRNCKRLNSSYSLGVLLLSVFMIVGCTQERTPTLPEQIKRDIFSIAELDGSEISVQTAGASQHKLSKAEKLRSFGEMQKLSLSGVEAPKRLRPMFADFNLVSQPSSQYRVTLKVDEKFLTAYKVAKSDKELTVEEQQLAVKEDGKLLVPIFKYGIRKYGTLKRVKNNLGELTSSLELLDQVPFDRATHVQVSLTVSSRLLVTASFDDKNRVFLKDRINKQVVSRSELASLIDISINMNKDSLVYIQLDDESLFLYKVTKTSALTEEQREALRLQANKDVMTCGVEVLEQLPQGQKENCVLVVHSQVGVQFVNAELSKDEKGIASDRVVYKSEADRSIGKLIKINKKPQVNEIQVANTLDPSRTILVSAVQGKQYLYRRTLEDTPNNFPVTFPGSQGPLEIVKFRFEKERMIVQRAQPLRPSIGNTLLDQEELLSIPVSYLTVEYTNSQGESLEKPVYKAATFDEAGAIAVFDWTRNTIPDVASPLNYYYVGSCFVGSSSKAVTDVDMRLSSGVLNFSVESVRALNPGAGCSSRYLSSTFGSYFYRSQAVFAFKERVSFKEYQVPKDESPILELPYNIQKLLGFGIFTFSKQVPNAFGNFGTTDTEKPLPMLRDFRNGKVVTYVLGGIPKSGALRAKLIQSTRRVVDDWNQAFHKAFGGTELQRSGDYVKLLVEGDDVVDGHLGDLDKNYIYYVEKTFASGVLGIGGPSANPSSGIIEASDVIVYGGNIKSSVEYLKIIAKAKSDYKRVRETLISEAEEKAKQNKNLDQKSMGPIPEVLQLPSFTQPPTNFNRQELELSVSAFDMKKLAPQLDVSAVGKKSLEPLVNSIKRGHFRHLTESLVKAKDTIYENRQLSMMQKILERAVESKSLLDAQSMEQIVNETVLEVYKTQLTAEQYARLQAEVSLQGFVNEVMGRLSGSHQIAEKIELKANDDFILDGNDDDLLVYAYATTLSHELGHSFGLRHNFWGSYDKANWKFGTEETSRNYSSIMDYIPDNMHEYDGVGPQDVFTLRAAYTGMLELNMEGAPGRLYPRGEGTFTYSIEGYPLGLAVKLTEEGTLLASIEDVQAFARVENWTNLNMSQLFVVPMKRYRYCSDEDVFENPTCNRHDIGTTPKEIVEDQIEYYKALYTYRNFPVNKLNFYYYNIGSYVARLFRSFTAVRQFMDDTIYHAIFGGVEDVGSMVQASVTGMFFLNNVIKAPDTFSSDNQTSDRFSVVGFKKEDETTEFAVIEKKSLQDRLLGNGDDRLAIRGVEFDKIVALIVLTQRSLGIPKYEQASLRISYPDFERILFREQVQSPLQLPTLSTLNMVLQDNIQPETLSQGGFPVPLGPEYQSKTTEALRFYAILGSILNLDTATLEEADNLSALFRVGSELGGKPEGRASIVQLGTNLNSATAINYYALGEGTVGDIVIQKASVVRDLIENETLDVALVNVITAAIKKYQVTPKEGEEESEEYKTAVKEYDNAIKALGSELEALPDLVGFKDAGVVVDYINNLMQNSAQLDQLAQQYPAYELSKIIEGRRVVNERLASSYPILAFVQRFLLSGKVGVPESMSKIVSGGSLERSYGTLYNGASLLNTLFYSAHPEYKQ